MVDMFAKSLLLTTALRHRLSEPHIEAGFARFQTIVGATLDNQAFCDAVADCLREGLIYEPVRLPEGALQCHWHLELTPKGVEAARSFVMAAEGRPPTSFAKVQEEVADGPGDPRVKSEDGHADGAG